MISAGCRFQKNYFIEKFKKLILRQKSDLIDDFADNLHFYFAA